MKADLLGSALGSAKVAIDQALEETSRLQGVEDKYEELQQAHAAVLADANAVLANHRSADEELVRLRVLVREMREVILRVEWDRAGWEDHHYNHYMQCPYCSRVGTHADACKLALAIKNSANV